MSRTCDVMCACQLVDTEFTSKAIIIKSIVSQAIVSTKPCVRQISDLDNSCLFESAFAYTYKLLA